MEHQTPASEESCPSWPKGLITTLTVLGVFKGKPIDANTSCPMCSRLDEGDFFLSDDEDDTSGTGLKNTEANDEDNHFADGQTGGERAGRQCDVCLSLLWDARGMVAKDSSKTVPGWVNSGSIGALSFLNLAIHSLITGATIVWYGVQFWGEIKDVTHFVSYEAYAVVIFSVSASCTVFATTQVICRPRGTRDDHWLPAVMDADYIARRMRCLSGRRFPLPGSCFLLVGAIWSCLNISMQAVNLGSFVNATSHQPDNNTSVFTIAKTYVGVYVVSFGLPIFVSFWHYVLVTRKALAAEMNLVLVFVRRNEGKLDRCRQRLTACLKEFDPLRRLVAGLMPLVVATGVLGLTVHVSWNYHVYSQDQNDSLSSANLLINIMIFSEKIMLFALPLYAVGGLNLNHVWQQFAYALSRQHRGQEHEAFWQRLMHFANELQPDFADIDLTVLLAVVSLYVGRNLGRQRLDYLSGGGF